MHLESNFNIKFPDCSAPVNSPRCLCIYLQTLLCWCMVAEIMKVNILLKVDI